MDDRLLRLYGRELQFVRELGSEFAREYPKVAGRLGLEGLECADPYVERLIESFAFLAARVQLKLESQFPRFTQHLLEMVYPQYLSPTPSMVVAQMKCSATDAARLQEGFVVPRGSSLRGTLGKDLQTACEYRTAHETTLWPVEIRHASYSAGLGEVAPGQPSRAEGGAALQATLRLRLAAVGGVKLQALALDRLPLFLDGEPELVGRLYEQLTSQVVGAFARSTHERGWREELAGLVRWAEDERRSCRSRRARSRAIGSSTSTCLPRAPLRRAGRAGRAVRRCAEGAHLVIQLALDRSCGRRQPPTSILPPAVNCSLGDRIHLQRGERAPRRPDRCAARLRGLRGRGSPDTRGDGGEASLPAVLRSPR
jgi:hypothetical protein